MGHLAAAVLCRQTAAWTLPVPTQGTRFELQSSAPVHSEEEPFVPPGTQCQKVFNLVFELDAVHHWMSPHPMYIEIPVAGNVYLALSGGVIWKFSLAILQWL